MLIKAYAKINLTLDILGTRPDGFHEVSMVMQSIDLHDDVVVEKADAGIVLSVEGSDLPADENNLAYRAAAAMKENFGVKDGVRIKLTKRIPMAAGLAGGSADAAAVILGINEVFNLNAPMERLSEIGATIGSDVPFCIMGGTMLSAGRGEILRELPPFPEKYLTLAKPPISISTPWAYKTYDKKPAAVHPDNEKFEAALVRGDTEEMYALMGNVLEKVASDEYDEIDAYKKIMMEAGAEYAQMSGSGPTVFAFAKDKEAAENIARVMKEKTKAEVFVTKTKKTNK